MSNYFLNRYAQMIGDSPEEIFVTPRNQVLRINTLKTTAKDITERLNQKQVKLTSFPGIPLAYSYKAAFSLGSTEEYLLGHYYLQEPASQVPVLALQNILGDLEGLTVLDMCAAPGSKTTQLAAAMKNTGLIVALDESRGRAEALANNCERCGVSNTQVYHKDALYASDIDLLFDAIILDAPCSGNFCSQKNWLSKRKPTDAKVVSRTQKELLDVALELLKPDGVLIYSTCSLEVEENEEVLDLLSDEYSIVDLGLDIGSPALSRFGSTSFREDMSNAVRLWPHRDGTQGFFVAGIIKK